MAHGPRLHYCACLVVVDRTAHAQPGDAPVPLTHICVCTRKAQIMQKLKGNTCSRGPPDVVGPETRSGAPQGGGVVGRTVWFPGRFTQRQPP